MKIINAKNNLNKEELELIKNNIGNNDLIIFPTETVYGIGANAFSSEAVKKIFKAKKRAMDNPLIVHVSNYEMILRCVKKIDNIEKKLIANFMPGPFTLILPKKDIIPNEVTAGLDSVGIRMPDHKIAYDIISYSNTPLAAPSANVSTKPSGTKISDIKNEFKDTVNLFIDGGEALIGLESTVVKVIDDIPTILRPGKITREDIIKVVGKCEYSKNINELINDIPESPGLKYKHYAPQAKTLLIYKDNEQEMINLVNQNIIPNTVVIGFKEHQNFIKSQYFISLGSINNLDEISHNIFSSLRSADTLIPDLIIIEGVKKDGLGIAIMNRLIKASNHYVIL